MIKKTFLAKIKKDLISFNKERNEIFRETRTVLQSSKSAIFALQRDDKKQALKDINVAEDILKSYQKTQIHPVRLILFLS